MLSIFIFAATFIASVVAQNTTGIPACGVTCAISSVASTSVGQLGNITFLCTDQAFAQAFLACQQKTCSSSDFLLAQQNGNAQCIADGHPLAVISAEQASTGSLNGTTTNSTNTTQSGGAPASSKVPTIAPSSTTSVAPAASTSSKSSAQTVVTGGMIGLLAVGFAILM